MVGHLEVIRHRLKSVESHPESCTWTQRCAREPLCGSLAMKFKTSNSRTRHAATLRAE